MIARHQRHPREQLIMLPLPLIVYSAIPKFTARIMSFFVLPGLCA